MKQYTFREADIIVRQNGFTFIGMGGRRSHFKYKRNGKILVLNKNLQAPVFQRLIKENKLNIK